MASTEKTTSRSEAGQKIAQRDRDTAKARMQDWLKRNKT